MRLSMNILADWLKQYEPKASINEGGRVIQNVRPFSDEHRIMPNNVYVSSLDKETTGGIMCINRNDFIFLHTDDENQVINDIMDAFDFYNTWSDSLYQNISQKPLKQILTDSAEVLPGHLMIADPAYYIVESSDPGDIAGKDKVLSHVNRYHIMDLEDIIRIEKHPHTRIRDNHVYMYENMGFSYNPYVRNLFPGGQHAGWLIMAGDNITNGMMDIEDELGDIIETWIEKNTDYKTRLNKDAIFYDILSNNIVDENKLRAGLMLLGFSENDEKMLYCIEAPGNLSGYTLIERVGEISQSARSFVTETRLVCIFFGAENKRKSFEKELAGIVLSAGALCGASPVFYDLMTLALQLDYARSSIIFRQETNDPDPIIHLEKTALFQAGKMLKNNTGSWFTHPVLLKLKAYDEKNNTRLLETLRVYIECERNYAQTARRLCMHRNTLLYRIQRINEITQTDFDNYYERLHIQLSFLLESKGQERQT